jgi:iron complex outermembrane receptor protein
MSLQILAQRPGRGRWVLLAAGLWAHGLLASAQTGGVPLSGRVSDHESREALPGATVLLLETQQATQTDPSGAYQLSAPAGLYHVQVRFVGYAVETAEVRLDATSPAVVRNFQLHPDAVVLKGAEVRGHRADEPNAQATNSLSGAALRQTSGQTLGEALQKISGVSAIQTGPSIFKPIIHGLHSNRISILNNGVRQEGQQWGAEHGPEIDPFVASRLTVVKGAASVRYGSDAIGGVVLVEPAALPDSAGTTAAGPALAGAGHGQAGGHHPLAGLLPAKHRVCGVRLLGGLGLAEGQLWY